MGARKILHLDLDAFFCAVEELHSPDLRGLAFAVGGKPNERGVVSSCSYAARAKGVRSAMPMSHALRLCPELRVVAPNHARYQAASEQVMSILHGHTALLEQLSIDEAFLDLTDLPQPGEELARMLQTQIREQTGLPCSLGVAANKLVAKTATDVAKARHRGGGYPSAILVVPPGEEAAFLAPLPVQSLWGVGPKTAESLKTMGVETIGDLTGFSEAVLMRRFGVMGHELYLRARGIDERPVTTEHSARSISQEITFEKDIADGARLRDTLRSLSEQVAFSLRSKRLCAGTVKIKLRKSDFSTFTRQVTLEQPADQDGVIYAAALSLFEGLWEKGQPVRLLGVGTSRLGPRAQQLSLWDTANQKERRLLDALDGLRERFGEEVVQSGRKLKGR
ncbi:MAG: DNA polymerase IV [Anaerolineaceae bacterium]|nr:DNA polymerase IV [Anaerolineaceae bacterium]